MIISTLNGFLYQWDTGRKILITDIGNTTVSEVHMCSENSDKAFVIYPTVTSDTVIADIPDVLLQEHGVLIVYAMVTSQTGRYTKYNRNFSITKRAKPQDYTFTESDYEAYYILANRIDKIQENLITKEDLNISVREAIVEAKNSDEFKGDPGEPGYTPVKGKDYFDGKNGLSAYEVATQNGFKGNELEWLASLVGSTGATGKDGQDYVLTEEDKQEIASIAADKVDIPEVPSIELDSTLKQQGKAADAYAVGKALSEVEKKIDDKIDTSQLSEAVDDALAEAKNSGTFDGEPGSDGKSATIEISGVYMVPHGSDPVATEETDSNAQSRKYRIGIPASKDGDPGPIGPQGPAGKTPELGVDYWTAADKQQIVTDVLAALPNASGVSF